MGKFKRNIKQSKSINNGDMLNALSTVIIRKNKPFIKFDKIKNTTLYDIAIGKIDDYTAHAYVNVYKFLKDSTIDWDKEYVVFINDW